MQTKDPAAAAPGVKGRKRLRRGFSTGTAMTAAARAALRHWLTGKATRVVAVRLPKGYFLPIPVAESHKTEEGAWASVIKDGGDDPDATHRMELRVWVKRRCLIDEALNPPKDRRDAVEHIPGIRLLAGEGIGMVTKPGLPVKQGEPAINPVPRAMLYRNVVEELRCRAVGLSETEPACTVLKAAVPAKPYVFFPFEETAPWNGLLLDIEVQAPKGTEIARHTLNPRLGIVGGISILGTTGIVKPFSHESYEETIVVALSVAASNGCRAIVLSTGGKSEHLAQEVLSGWPGEAFVQIADFFEFAVRQTTAMAFDRIVHSVFFGKAVKMAQGLAYTHAHRSPLDLNFLAQLARREGCDDELCREVAEANTARHALELLRERGALEVVRAVAREALNQSVRIAGESLAVRLLLFDYDGTLLADVESS